MSAGGGSAALRFDWTADGMQYHQHGQYVGQEDYAKLEQQRAALVEALKEARKMVEEWGAYTSPYFQEKHDLQGDLAKLDAALCAAGEGMESLKCDFERLIDKHAETLSERDRLRAEMEDWRKLADPTNLHVNLLQGKPAQLTKAQLAHLLGQDYTAMQAEVESLRAQLAAERADAERGVDEIVTGLYRRFEEWSQRGFGPDDVTWCEVKADVIALIAARAEGGKGVDG